MTSSQPTVEHPSSAARAGVLRALDVDAAEAAAALIRAAFGAQSRATEPPSSALKETTKSIAAKIAAGGGFGVYVDDRLIALALWHVDGEALMIARVSVSPTARGQSLTRRLIEACDAEARALGLHRLRLRVRLMLPENEQLFARMGFSRARIEAHAGFQAPTVVVMEKALA
jgi:GNAT superfamily N-acetyltransferase